MFRSLHLQALLQPLRLLGLGLQARLHLLHLLCMPLCICGLLGFKLPHPLVTGIML